MALGGSLIGRAIELRDDAAGLWGAWRVSATEAGDETLTLVQDGVLDELSIGFQERQNRREADGTITRTKANLIEVSVVLQGAYGRKALVSAVRSLEQGNPCQCGTSTSRLDQSRQILAKLPVLSTRG
jgi:HK97 family phage prohead protease